MRMCFIMFWTKNLGNKYIMIFDLHKFVNTFSKPRVNTFSKPRIFDLYEFVLNFFLSPIFLSLKRNVHFST